MKQAIKLVDKTGNQINTIEPYRTKYGWAFDDEEVGLHAEPFIANVPQMIDKVVGKKNRFVAHISHSPIPDHTIRLMKTNPPKSKGVIEKIEDGWYEMEGTGMVGWLCPATLKYFKDYPDNIYVKIE